MQNQNMAAEAAQTQKTIIPKVRYHPTIQTRTPGDWVQAKTGTKQTKKSKPVAARPPDAENKAVQNQNPHKTLQDSPVPAANRRQNQKPGQRTAADPDQLSEGGSPSPDQVPVGLGVQLDTALVEQVEVLTRGQSTNPEWFAWRKNRITASVAHRIAHCRFLSGKSKTPPTSYLSAVTGEGSRVQTRAMSWGVNMEAEAVRRYQQMKSSSRPVVVQECGLFIDAQRPWLAASPDGIVIDRRTGQWLLCLEVKCPYKHRNRRVEDACRDDPAFCLTVNGGDAQKSGRPVYSLKTSHSYYTQIQVQLALTGLQQADLVVFTLKEVAIVPVTFDPALWAETLSRLERFYRDAVLPHIRDKSGRGTAAAWAPEL